MSYRAEANEQFLPRRGADAGEGKLTGRVQFFSERRRLDLHDVMKLMIGQAAFGTTSVDSRDDAAVVGLVHTHQTTAWERLTC